MDDDDGDTGGGGSGGGSNEEAGFFSSGSLVGGRGSNVGEREKSEFEQTASGALAGVVGAGLGIPGASTALRNIVAANNTFDVDLSTGKRVSNRGQSGGGDSESSSNNFNILGGNAAGQIGGQSTGGQNVASAADLAIQRALGFQEEAAASATTSLEEGRTASQAFLDPFAGAGVRSLDQQEALLGNLGAEAQQAALASFRDSPEAQFAAQEEEQALVRNALAIGDAGGGRFADELSSRASGRFGQRLDTRLAQLAQLSGQGQQAATGQSNIEQNTAANLSNLFLGTGENQASAVLGQEVARAGTASEANRIAALKEQQQSQQDAAFQSQLFGLGASIAKPIISSFF